MVYKTKITPSFRSTDMAGIVYFNQIHNIFHDAYEDFIAEHICSKEDWFANPEWAVPIRRIETDFLQPLRPFVEYDLSLRIEKIGSSSFQIATEITKDNKPHATLLTTHVFISKKGKEKINIPVTLIEKMQILLQE